MGNLIDAGTIFVVDAGLPPILQSITISASMGSLSQGTSEQFVATGNYGDGSTTILTNLVTWNSSNSGVVTVSASGLATASNQGTTDISASLNGVGSNVFPLTVTAAALTSIVIIAPSNTLVAGSTLQFSATGTYSNGSTQDITHLVAWNSSNTSTVLIGFVSGLATGVVVGATNISASLSGIPSNQFSLTVSAPSAPTVTAFRVLFGTQSYPVTGTSRVRLPWQVTGVQVMFSQPITAGAVTSLGGLAATGFSGLGTNTLTWSFASLAVADVSLTLAGSGAAALTNSGGVGLNGGAGASQSLKILWGDFNDDGGVSAADLVGVNNAQLGAYNIFADINGDGVVNAADVQAVRPRIGTSLP